MLTDPRQLPDAYAAAVYDKDVSAFIALYALDARAFDAWDATPVTGLDAFRAMAANWFDSLGDERVKVTFQDMHSSVGDDVAALHGFITFQAVDADEQPLRSGQERVSWLLERRQGQWLVVHQHTSLPAKFVGAD